MLTLAEFNSKDYGQYPPQLIIISSSPGDPDGGAGGSGWQLSGNTGTSESTNFLGTKDNIGLIIKTNNQERVMISNTGNIGIGTSARSEYKLAVNGDAIFTKIKVKLYSAWPDYVFSSTYELMPLPEVEKFIKARKHLPGVPSAIEISSKGVDVGENQAVLLKKIEELTLYLIEQNKQLQRQDQLISDLQQEMERLKK